MRTISIGAVAALTLLLASCGGGSGSSSNQKTPTSADQFPKRVYVSNTFFGQINVLDSAKDAATAFRVTGMVAPTKMVLSPGQYVLVFDSSSKALNFVDLDTETTTTSFTLNSDADDMVLTSDGKFAYIALRNLSEVAFVDVVNKTIAAFPAVPSVPGTPAVIPQARRLLLSKDGTKLLVFSDNSDFITIINTTDKTIATVVGFDRAYTGLLSSDSNKVYILSCGPESGGTVAKVSVLDLTTNTITAQQNVNGATVGLLDGNSLYVAGNATGSGTLDVLDATTLAPSKTINIYPGLHTRMASPASGKVYVGAETCSASVNGCLSIVNISGGTVAPGEDPADPLFTSRIAGGVTSILPITGRSVVYVIRGGNLRIVDNGTDKPQAKQIDIAGAVNTVIEIK